MRSDSSIKLFTFVALLLIVAVTVTVWAVLERGASASDREATANGMAYTAQIETWRDAGVTRPMAAVSVSAAAGWRDAGAGSGGVNAATFTAGTATWGDAGVSHSLAAARASATGGWQDAGASGVRSVDSLASPAQTASSWRDVR